MGVFNCITICCNATKRIGSCAKGIGERLTGIRRLLIKAGHTMNCSKMGMGKLEYLHLKTLEKTVLDKAFARRVLFHYVILSVMLGGTLIGCHSSPSSISPQMKKKEFVDQSAGLQVIEALSKAYGMDSTVVGDFLDSPRCPYFLEGMYFNGSTLVFQVRGDTLKARRTLEAAAKSGAFRLETATKNTFTQKQLKEIMNIIRSKHRELTDESLKSNMNSWGMDSHHIHVTFILNTPETRKSFREKIIDSPAVYFEGPEIPEINECTGVTDTLGISLRPEYTAYSTKTKTASFILVNQSNRELLCGERYFITYEDEQGIWRNLPVNDSFIDIGYIVPPGKRRIHNASLYPEIHPNTPGRYRFFYDITLGDTRTNILMMTEFRLTDDKNELEKVQKLNIPITPAMQDLSCLDSSDASTDDSFIYDVVEEMSEFPGGMEKLMEYIKAQIRYPDTAQRAGIQGRVIVSFVIEKNGAVSHPEVIRSVHSELDAEAIRIVSSMPKWKPGKQNGVPKRTRFTVPVAFRLQKE